MKTYDVFTPAGVPTVTYIERENQNLEKQLRSAIRTPGQIVSLSGPSKSGKTVLVKRVIPDGDLISISGGAIRGADMLWDRVLNWMEAPSETTSTSANTVGGEASAKIAGKTNWIVASGEAEGALKGHYDHQSTKAKKFGRSGIDQVIREIANSDFIVFIDDFHYMTKDIQSDVAKQIKEAAEKGVSICTASVPHRSDDVVRGNPELRGRVKAIDFEYWKSTETAEIARRGFKELGMIIDEITMERLSSEAFGSPQLMQQICLQTCFYLAAEESCLPAKKFNLTDTDLKKILEQAATTTDFSSLLDALHAGPKQRGTTRSQFDLIDNSKGDVYRCILLAMKGNPARLSFNYEDIYRRTREVCRDRDSAPSGSSIAQALEQIGSIARSTQESSAVLEWSDDVLDIVDPYFLYYLRCSSRLGRLKR